MISRLGRTLATAVLASCAGAAHAQALLSAEDVRRVALQAANEAERRGLRAHVAVTDAEGRVLAVFRMTGAPMTTRIQGTLDRGLEGLDVPADAAAVGKAGTGALLSSGGNAFSARTASFIVQEHFPPGVSFTPGGPLFGVQLSNLACSDVKSAGLPLGFSGDPGGTPLYKDGRVAGGVGVEGDGVYGVDRDPSDADAPAEEAAALAGAAGFDPPAAIRADNILADGIRLPFAGAAAGQASAAAAGQFTFGPVAAPPSSFVPLALGGLSLETQPAFPIRRGSALTADEVSRILAQAARQAALTRAAIRQPLGSDARVSIAVTDVDGALLGVVRTLDAPGFGFDVAVQKARTAGFFSGAGAGDELRRLGFAAFLTGEVPLDGSLALSSRAVGFLAQPFFPPGIDGAAPGPFSVVASEWSPFNTGLQLELARSAITGGARGRCTDVARLPNGITIFPGGLPLYKDGRLAGAIGISGDGVDQDDLIAAAGASGFEPADERLADRVVVRGVRLPYVKFPRHPER